MEMYNSDVYRPDRGKSISTGQRPVNDECNPTFQGLRASIIQFRRALPYANAKRALPFSNDSNNYKFFISHF
jgi:hypothetical protein